ncbi:hypothetical protein EVA_14596 [gut metagenome]|uniref:Uncharacterized protein n=1 Tax=gut metagenome TaxID=749906 RepID=J9G658_9ZZZZ
MHGKAENENSRLFLCLFCIIYVASLLPVTVWLNLKMGLLGKTGGNREVAYGYKKKKLIENRM